MVQIFQQKLIIFKKKLLHRPITKLSQIVNNNKISANHHATENIEQHRDAKSVTALSKKS